MLGLAVLAAVAFASSRQAQWFPAESLRFSLRSAIYWVLFLVAADQVRSERTAWRLLPWLLAGAAVSAVVGWLAAIIGSIDGAAWRQPPVHRGRRGADRRDLRLPDHRRDGLGGVAARLPAPPVPPWQLRPGRVAVLVGLVLVGGALPLTVSRGALLGLAAGLGVMLAVGVARFGRRAVALPLGAGLLVLAWAIVLQVGSGLPLSRVLAETDGSLYGATYAAPGRLTLAPGQHDAVRVDLTNTGTATWRTEAPAWQSVVPLARPEDARDRCHSTAPAPALEGPSRRASGQPRGDVVAPATTGELPADLGHGAGRRHLVQREVVPTAAMVVEVRAGAGR